MIEWFDERYISRDEHEKVVAYYKKLVARLYGDVRELRTLVEAQPTNAFKPRPEISQPRTAHRHVCNNNIIHFDFRPRG